MKNFEPLQFQIFDAVSNDWSDNTYKMVPQNAYSKYKETIVYMFDCLM